MRSADELWNCYLRFCAEEGPLTEEWPDNRVRGLAKLVATAVAEEREACAGIAEHGSQEFPIHGAFATGVGLKVAKRIAAAIRARSEAKP